MNKQVLIGYRTRPALKTAVFVEHCYDCRKLFAESPEIRKEETITTIRHSQWIISSSSKAPIHKERSTKSDDSKANVKMAMTYDSSLYVHIKN